MVSSRLMYSPVLTEYSFGPDHPMGPNRVLRSYELAESLGVLDRMLLTRPAPPDDDLLRLVHSDDYIAAVQSGTPQALFGVGTADNPLFPRMHEIASQVSIATVEAMQSVASGDVDRAVNISGGLHHAMPSGASGFCVYNDAAIAIRKMQADHPGIRIAYLDIDAHHGDGVQEVFWNDPSVLTISLHETPLHLFPGTGFAHEVGGRNAMGTAVNVALPATTGDADWLRAFDAIVPHVLEAFGPDLLVTQHGADAHRRDPLTDLQLTLDGMALSYRWIADLAEKYAGGKWVALGGGGYAMPDVVPRAWAHLIATVAGTPLDPTTPIPDVWREPLGEAAPETMGEGQVPVFTSFDEGFDPASRLDQAIRATRRAVFPELGLDPTTM